MFALCCFLLFYFCRKIVEVGVCFVQFMWNSVKKEKEMPHFNMFLTQIINSTFSACGVGNLLTYGRANYLWLKTSKGNKFKFHQVTHRKGTFPFTLLLGCASSPEELINSQIALFLIQQLWVWPRNLHFRQVPRGDANTTGLGSLFKNHFPRPYDQSYCKPKIIHVIPSL